MNRSGGSITAAAGAMALGLTLVPLPLAAQSGSDWRLPGATVRPAPTGAQGPVDRDNPVVTTTVARPSPTPSPEPAVAPPPAGASTGQLSPAAAAPGAATSRPTASRPAAAAPRQAGAASGPVIAPATIPPGPTAASQATPVDTGVAVMPTDLALSPPSGAASPPIAAAPGWYWPWIAGAAALLALVFAGLWWRRTREPKVLQIAFERPVVPMPRPEASESTAPAARPEPAAAKPVVLPEPQLALGLPAGLGITLEARRLNASLMATTLSYVLTLTNTGTEPLSALAVEGDMVSAHASLPPEAQIASDALRLELRHALVALAPGESAEFTGDFRLPLTAVTPIRAGDAAYFVPLARLRIEASTPAGGSLVQVQTFVVGELPEAPGAPLRPFRLDLGPRTYSRLGQRAVI